MPFQWHPARAILDHMLACRLIDLSESAGNRIDRVIGLKFPAYLMPHPHKTLWLMHQYRAAYDLWDSPYGNLWASPQGQQIRQAIQQADRRTLQECQGVYTISQTVADRVQQFNQIPAQAIYSPPFGEAEFYCEPAADYFFFPSRLNVAKRQQLVLEALTYTQTPVQVYFAGRSDDQATEQQLQDLVTQWQLGDRVKFLGTVDESTLRAYYAKAIGVIYPPFDEDYGYVTLEAMLAAKPVITCQDSGGPLEFVQDQQTGYVCPPEPQALAQALDRLWDDRALAQRLGAAGRDRYASLQLSWPQVIRQLLGE
jgi:glycosyltransferase involved in cell wall biosynthesis